MNTRGVFLRKSLCVLTSRLHNRATLLAYLRRSVIVSQMEVMSRFEAKNNCFIAVQRVESRTLGITVVHPVSQYTGWIGSGGSVCIADTSILVCTIRATGHQTDFAEGMMRHPPI